jgi:uncharacterized protein YndB with AHSA1/START domain
MASQSAAKLKELVITREFDAPRERVWKAWTDPEIVKRWWGPEGFFAPSIKIDLRVGGMYIFAMQGPPGSQLEEAGYNAGVFKEIVPNEKLVLSIYMSDKDGNMVDPTKYGMDPDFTKESFYTILFEDIGSGRTRLSLVFPKPESEAEYQAILKSGMEEGWKSQLNKLAAALK